MTVCRQRTKKVLLIHNKESINNAYVSGNIQHQDAVDWVAIFWHGMCYADTNLRNSQQLFRSLFEHLFNALI